MKKFSLSVLFAFTFYLISCSSSSTKGTISLGDLVTINGSSDSGSVLTYNWKDLVPGYTESDSHLYGFDRDVLSDSLPEYGKNVYLSVADGEQAYLTTHLSSATQDSYILQDSNGVTVSVVDGQNVALSAGDYTLYGVEEDTTVDLERYVHVISYPVRTVPAKYVQIDGSGWDTANDSGSYTFEKTKNNFDMVYAQAVLKSDFEISSPADYGLPDTLVIDMTNIDTTLLTNAFSKAQTLFANSGDSADSRVIIAVNQMRKQWPLASLVTMSNDSALSFTNFDPLDEKSGTVYKMESKDGRDCGGVGSTINVEIRGSRTIDGFIGAPYYAFYNNSLVHFGSCDILYTDNGYPIVPTNTTAAGISKNNVTISTTGSYVFSVIWAPRSAGETSQNVLMHEIGHSLGLTDVYKDTTTISKVDDTTETMYYLADGTVRNGIYTRTTEVASTETNLMSWQKPNGPKLRYRGQQVVCSGGVKENGVTVEKPIEGLFDYQWSCLHGECDWTNQDRIGYWYPSFYDVCKTTEE